MGDVVGRRFGVRPRSRLLHQPVLLPELRDSIEFTGEKSLDWRLPLRVEGQLWSAYS